MITITCTFSILFSSCKENVQKVDVDSNSTKTITLSSIEKSFQDTSYLNDPQIVVLETLDKSLLSEINRISMDDNTLFVLDGKLDNIFMFDINGKYINKIDRKGEGPGEYVQLNDFSIDTDKKQIILLCAIPEKRMYFTYNGEFIKEDRLHDFYSNLTTDGNYIYFEKTVLENPNNQLHILDTRTAEKHEGLEPLDIKNHYYINGNSLIRGEKNTYFVRRYDNSIYELTNGKIIKKYYVDFKKHTFPDWFLTEEDPMVILDECNKHEYIFSMSNVTNNDKYMMFYTNRGVFVYDKKNDVLTGYKQILNSKLPIIEYPFIYYFPIENTNKIVCSIDEPSFIKHMAAQIVAHPDTDKIKKMRNKYPKMIEEIIKIGEKITEDNNPVLFIYELKD